MLRDVRLAVRMLRSWRFGAAAAVLTLAIGIGTASSMYALVRMALASTIPDVEDLPSLGRIYASSRSLGVERAQLTLKDADVLAASASFESVGAYSSDESEMTAGGEPVTISTGEVSEGFFAAMRAHAAAGRLPSADEVHQGAAIAVVSDAVWRKHFAGRSLDNAVATIDGTPRTIVGVLPPGFGFSFIGISADVWLPMTRGGDAVGHRVGILTRLKPGVTWTAASAELDALGRAQNPNGLWTWSAITVEQDVKRRTVGGFAMMFGPALIVLLIGCTNVACMLLARGIDRDVELSVRSALGASRSRIISQLVTENLVLAMTGGTLGIAMAYAVLRAVAAAMAQFQPQTAAMIPSNAATLLPMAFGFSAVACLLFGTIPAVRLSRRDIATSLKGGTMPAVARFVGYRARDLVVFLELGSAVALVLTTAMFVRFFAEMQRVTPAFDVNRIVAVRVPSRTATVAERVSAVPGVSRVSLTTGLPGYQRGSAAAEVRTAAGRVTRAGVTAVDSAFFETVGIPIVRGRWTARAETTGVAMVSEAAAARLWPGEDPIGASVTIASGHGSSKAIVIGLSRNAVDGAGLAAAGLLIPDVYVPLDPAASDLLLLARADANPKLLLKPIREAARTSAAERPPRVGVLGESASFVHPDSLFIIKLFGGFGIIAMLLAASGIFGVVSQSVAQRTTEFGVRMAMGASAGQVLRMVLAREARLIAAAAATGIVGTVLVTRSAFAEMLALTGPDPRMWAAVVVLCGGLAAVAVVLSTYRIVRLDPWVVLRQS
jgi:putative ABC transport system permease protein